MYRDERIAYENMYAEMIELRARIYASLGWVITPISVLRNIDSFMNLLNDMLNIFVFHFDFNL